jgi:hypothetical protein
MTSTLAATVAGIDDMMTLWLPIAVAALVASGLGALLALWLCTRDKKPQPRPDGEEAEQRPRPPFSARSHFLALRRSLALAAVVSSVWIAVHCSSSAALRGEAEATCARTEGAKTLRQARGDTPIILLGSSWDF